MSKADPHISETSFHVRYAETDAMGFVHHAVYLVWFEEGRSAFIREQGWSYAEIERSGYFLVASDLRARYLKAARYDQLVTVRVWLAQVKSRQLAFACEVLDSESRDCLFSANLKLHCLNRAGKIARIPSDWQAWLRE
ncbi:MAG: thioesterase family protein [Chloroflexi bacterium]|nr:thioesterase family protein [Chloroflexota bacterium]